MSYSKKEKIKYTIVHGKISDQEIQFHNEISTVNKEINLSFLIVCIYGLKIDKYFLGAFSRQSLDAEKIQEFKAHLA